LEQQTWQPSEVIVADGCSTDGSREWLARAAEERPWLTVVDNLDRTVPAAMNAALAAATGDFVARMDAHADYAPDHIETLVKVLLQRPDVVSAGGAMASAGNGPWGRAIASSLSRRIGLGGARHRVGGTGGPIEHVFTGCYRRPALAAAGGYDERLLANEDFEMDARLRSAGLVVWLHPEARSTWYVRETVPALAKQMWRYGHFKALTLRLRPESLRLRQLAPPALVVLLVALLATLPLTGAIALAGYLAAAGGAGALAARADGAPAWRGAVVPPVVHLSWGVGLLLGAVRFGARPGVRRRAPRPEVAA
jgi:cellulose synthase/poly-beta-1,6-N-acetylglucosamine synthase-like glycosyltransferase